MANHASAKKRSRQNKTRNTVNSQYLSKFRNALNKFNTSLEAKNEEEIQKSFSNVNSITVSYTHLTLPTTVIV